MAAAVMNPLGFTLVPVLGPVVSFGAPVAFAGFLGVVVETLGFPVPVAAAGVTGVGTGCACSTSWGVSPSVVIFGSSSRSSIGFGLDCDWKWVRIGPYRCAGIVFLDDTVAASNGVDRCF